MGFSISLRTEPLIHKNISLWRTRLQFLINKSLFYVSQITFGWVCSFLSSRGLAAILLHFPGDTGATSGFPAVLRTGQAGSGLALNQRAPGTL